MAERKFVKEVLPNNELWRRGGKLNQKRHIELTDEEKANIAECDGIKHEHKCKNPTFRCSKCGNYGCSQEVPEKCTKQGFKNDICLNCGAAGTRIPVMKEELAAFVEAWEKQQI
jgi:hypothetical protein